MMDAQNKARRQMSLEQRNIKEAKLKTARDHNENILGEQRTYLMEKERMANIKKAQFDQKRELQYAQSKK